MHLTVLNLKLFLSGRSIFNQAHHTFRSAPGPHHPNGLIPPVIGAGSLSIMIFIARNSFDRLAPYSTYSKERSTNVVLQPPWQPDGHSAVPGVRAPYTI